MKKLAIGIDIGGTRTKIGLVDIDEGKVLDLLIYPTETQNGEKFLADIGEAINKFKLAAAKEGTVIIGVGFGIPGFVFKDGVVDSTYGFLAFMEDYPLKDLIETQHQLPCRLDNDARVVALGEALFGDGKNYGRVLVLTLGTGLGLGFIVDGQLNEPLPYAHMGGHITIIQNDVVCYCGKTGCLESLVSATGLCDAARRMNWPEKYKNVPLTAENIFIEREKNNPDAIVLVNDFIRYLKTGIDNYINLYAPEIIVLGGGVAKGLANDLDKLYSPNHLHAYKNYKMVVRLSKLEAEAGILGGAALFN